jgi:predicted acetyltransferase
MNITVKPVETSRELRLANDLCADTHGEGTPARALEWLRTCGVNYPGFELEHTRIAVLDNEIVGALRLTSDTIRLGEARLKMGGLGWVTTAPQHRRKGICRLLMHDVLRYMREHGYHLSMLFGIPDFYGKFGYVTTLADYSVSVDTMEALTFDNPFKVSKAKPSEIRALQHMHDANDAGVACSLLRVTGHIKSKWQSAPSPHVLKDDDGHPLAYFDGKRDGDCFRVTEVGVSEPGLCGTVVKAAATMAEAEMRATIRFLVPPPHPLARYLLQFKSRHQMRIDRDADGMMAFINIGETLEHMIPEWEDLLSKALAREVRTELTLVVDGTCFRVRANRGAMDVALSPGANKISLSQWDLMHLLTGYRHAEDILDAAHGVLTKDARALALTLFPKRCPFVWHFDRF